MIIRKLTQSIVKNLKIIFTAACLLSLPGSILASPVKVACVGNSITYGAGVDNREKNSYPMQLQYLLGDGYEVLNAGCGGATLLSEGDYPYVERDEYRRSLEFAPDIVIIKLGTNDSKPQNAAHLDKYKEDYQKLINSYLNLDSRPRVILATPVRCWLPEEAFSTRAIEDVMIPAIEALAYENGLEILNFYSLLPKEKDHALMPDDLHPSSIGAGMMACKVYEMITGYDDNYDISNVLSCEKVTNENFHGYAGAKYKLNGIECIVVKPKRVAKGRPWVLRARFWGHEPQVDVDLLEKGFHIAYCDVGDLYGAQEAVARWDYFYGRMTSAGLGREVVLEGMSRGGLPVYNWAVRNPDRVACIYADAPVLDIKSWPMGEGKYRGSEEDVNRMMAAYGFTSRQQALDWKQNPVDHAAAMARSGIPMLHVVGDKDDVVPVDENTGPFEEGVLANGGDMTVIHKTETGHHPHSLAVPKPIVDFILRATGRKINYCVIPAPGNEFRSGAGWVGGNEWHSVSEEISEVVGRRKLELLLIGNSITQGFGGNREIVAYKPGKAAMDSAMKGAAWESAGISGDRTQSVLWRIGNGGYEKAEPRTVVITIGINNLTAGDSPVEVAEGITAGALAASQKFGVSRVVVMGPLPAGLEADGPLRRKCNEVHAVLKELPLPGNVIYTDPTGWFVNSDGSLKVELYGGDYLHLSGKGYEVWAGFLAELAGR